MTNFTSEVSGSWGRNAKEIDQDPRRKKKITARANKKGRINVTNFQNT